MDKKNETYTAGGINVLLKNEECLVGCGKGQATHAVHGRRCSHSER